MSPREQQEYSRLGYKIFPVVKGGKRPACRNGVKDATADMGRLQTLFGNGECNIGMSAEGLLVIDLDFVKGGGGNQTDLDKAKSFYDDGTCPLQRTRSGGFHLVYRMPWRLQSLLKNATRIDRIGDVEVDLRITGGYIVVAPSFVEADNKAGAGRYTWERELVVIDKLPFPPQRVIDKLAAVKPVRPVEPPSNPKPTYWSTLGDNDPVIIDRAGKYVQKMPESISGQGGHNALLATATALTNGFGLSPDAAFQLLWNEYNPRCQPPWSEREIRHKINEALKTGHPNPRGHLAFGNRDSGFRSQASGSTPEVRSPESEALSESLSDNRFVWGNDIFADFSHDVLHGSPPTVWLSHADEDNPLNWFSMRPGLVTVLGGAPGAGKTAWVMQNVFDAMSLDPDIKTLVCNVEMTPTVLLERMVAKYSGVRLYDVMNRIRYDSTAEKLQQGLDTIARAIDRMAFMQTQCVVEDIQDVAGKIACQIVVLDYCQRIHLDNDEKSGTTPRERVNGVMDAARAMAKSGMYVIVVSALSRPGKDKDYSDAGLDAFRESSELEYGADDAYILAHLPKKDKDDPDYENKRILRCVKKRYDLIQDIPLVFDGRHQSFVPDWKVLEAADEEKNPHKARRKPGHDGRAAASGEKDIPDCAPWDASPEKKTKQETPDVEEDEYGF